MLFSMVLFIFLLLYKNSSYFKVKLFCERLEYPSLPSKNVIFEFSIFENLCFHFLRLKTHKYTSKFDFS